MTGRRTALGGDQRFGGLKIDGRVARGVLNARGPAMKRKTI
jgi:hypothetical protein